MAEALPVKTAAIKKSALLYVSIGMSVISLVYALWVHRSAEELADHALQKREAELVQHWNHSFDQVLDGMGVDSRDRPKNPKTLEELFDPLIKVMNRVGEPNVTGTNSGSAHQ